MEIRLLKNHPDAQLPSKTHPTDSGWDLCCVEDFTLISGNPAKIIDTGLKIAYISEGYDLEIRCRSGIAAKFSVCVVNGIGTIDNGYRGPLGIILKALHANVSFKKGERIAQLVPRIIPESFVTWGESIVPTERSEGGYGSTELKP